MDEIQKLKYQIRLLKITYCTCRHCKNADLYIPHYTRRGYSPRCKISKKQVNPDQSACENFTDFNGVE